MTPPHRTACSPNRSVSVSSLKAGLDHPAARAADPLRVGERKIERVAARVLLDGDQPGNPRAFEELAADEMAGALRRDQRHVHVARRLDLAVVDREPVPEQQHVAGVDSVADARFPYLAMQLVGDEHHHEVALGRRDGGILDPEPVVARLRDAARVRPQPDDHVDPGVLEVQGVGVALGAVPDDRDGLAVEELEICVVVVEHGA